MTHQHAIYPKNSACNLGLDIRDRKGFLRRAFEALCMKESRRRRAEQELARHVASRGGPMTDDLERQITHFLFTSDWHRSR